MLGVQPVYVGWHYKVSGIIGALLTLCMHAFLHGRTYMTGPAAMRRPAGEAPGAAGAQGLGGLAGRLPPAPARQNLRGAAGCRRGQG